jgi:hypothetical protein
MITSSSGRRATVHDHDKGGARGQQNLSVIMHGCTAGPAGRIAAQRDRTSVPAVPNVRVLNGK